MILDSNKVVNKYRRIKLDTKLNQQNNNNKNGRMNQINFNNNEN